eukprot:CAMPEP_0170492616 /NCGR_PEP_ID=MMETSP0208-20121228/12519_1 /TAXON_ID=197538 /ORGANISM="Strombidium inclinatum, Strain S3" /LENGTH=67 /DNA_ID=CAMNT_0010768387 /DNA_START=657 /DNA_END=860 /DNA_ORIENTATION=+
MPFIRRHVSFIFMLGIAYVLVNFIVTKIEGEPVYPVMTWELTAVGILVPSVTILFGVGVFFSVAYVS